MFAIGESSAEAGRYPLGASGNRRPAPACIAAAAHIG